MAEQPQRRIVPKVSNRDDNSFVPVVIAFGLGAALLALSGGQPTHQPPGDTLPTPFVSAASVGFL